MLFTLALEYLMRSVSSITLRNSLKVNEMRVGDSEITFQAENDAAGHTFEHSTSEIYI